MALGCVSKVTTRATPAAGGRRDRLPNDLLVPQVDRRQESNREAYGSAGLQLLRGRDYRHRRDLTDLIKRNEPTISRP